MKRLMICTLTMAGLVATLDLMPTTHAGEGDLKKKLEQMRKDLDDLDKKEKDIAKARADLQKAISDLQREINRKAEDDRVKREIEQKKFDEADRKKHYAKIELRGKLLFSKSAQPHLQPDAFYVMTNETRWPLAFGDKKDLQKQAEKWTGKPVIVTGAISTTLKKINPIEYPNLPYDGWPNIGNPFPRPVQPGQNPRIVPGHNPYPYYPLPFISDIMLPVAVESIRLVEEK
jgi:hypothetical protein